MSMYTVMFYLHSTVNLDLISTNSCLKTIRKMYFETFLPLTTFLLSIKFHLTLIHYYTI